MAESIRKYGPDLRAGAKSSTSLLTLFVYDGVFVDMNRILRANYSPDVKSDISFSFKRTHHCTFS